MTVGNLTDALAEGAQIESHLHPTGSYDPADFAVPTGHEEVWRFTPLRRLRGLHDDAPLDADRITVDVRAGAGVTAEPVDVDIAPRASSGYVPADRVSARAWSAAQRSFVVTIPKESVVAEPTVVTVTGTGTDAATAGHAVITAEPYSQSTVVLVFQGSATFADNVEIVVGDGAQLTVVSVHDWADDAVQHSHHHALVGRDARLRHVAVTFGGDVVRFTASVEYAGSGGEAELLGIYFADAGQHLEHRLFVDHNAPQTVSNVEYKGALQGDGAHTVWIGDVLIRKVAEGISTYEANRNLVLTEGARADSVPNLEIETGEIAGAGHASTTGRFDDEQLFYLQSRGLPAEVARRLVVRGFFADIVRKIGVPDVQERLTVAIEAELAKSGH